MSDPSMQELCDRLIGLHGRGYKAYKGIAGCYIEPRYTLWIDHVQGDPYADPSRLCAIIPHDVANLPAWALTNAGRRTSTADFFNRVLARHMRATSPRGKPVLSIQHPGQQVLRRNSVMVQEDGTVEVRFRCGLPAQGRRIDGRRAAELFEKDIPRSLNLLRFASIDGSALKAHMEAVEDAQAARAQLQQKGLVAFVGDGAILPRESGVSDAPLERKRAAAFYSPESLRVTLQVPNAGSVHGMGIPQGITLVVGGGYHGKSTLLRAIERGIYDHIPGDGRERVVSVAGAVKIRAEDKRCVTGTDISNFIGELPGQVNTRSFDTESASGSTSQAASIVEALEVGCEFLLVDEDTSATNFMIRDARMQALIEDSLEPITPFIDRVEELAQQGVSTIAVVGGSGDYFDVAHTVISMQHYRAADRTGEARAIAAQYPVARRGPPRPWQSIAPRYIASRTEQHRDNHRRRAKVLDLDRVALEGQTLDLGAVEQLVEVGQTKAVLAAVLHLLDRLAAQADGEAVNLNLQTILAEVVKSVQEAGLDILNSQRRGDFAEFRPFELAAVFNRLRILKRVF